MCLVKEEIRFFHIIHGQRRYILVTLDKVKGGLDLRAYFSLFEREGRYFKRLILTVKAKGYYFKWRILWDHFVIDWKSLYLLFECHLCSLDDRMYIQSMIALTAERDR